MKNTLPVMPTVRNPRGLVKINGTVIPGWTSVEVVNNTFFQADTFSASFAVSKLPTEFGPDWWSDTDKMELELFIGFPPDPKNFSPSDLDSMIFGLVDGVDWSINQQEITVSGRDLTSRFLDTKSDEKYPNLTASQIAAKIAAAQGLTAIVTATDTKAGRYYSIDNVLMQDNRTQWDLLCYLARQENFTVYVKGKELHFEPMPALDGEPYVIQCVLPGQDGGPVTGNFQRLNVSRSLTIAKDIVVKVRSWNAQKKNAFVRQAKASRKGSNGDRQVYVYDIPGLTADQAQERAKQMAEELSKHERKASIDGPADNILQRTDVLKIEGTKTSWDQTYFIDSIRRSLDAKGGYDWSIGVKNHSPETQVTV
jgi:Mu-like prophage tail protein gpP